MTAKEMFEKLKYTKQETEERIIYRDNLDSIIIFNKNDKIYYTSFFGHALLIDIEIHKAITQQIKELNWLNE